jgi:hypothetical protein
VSHLRLQGNRGFVGSSVWLIKNALAAMIDKTTFVSQQRYKGPDRDYVMWMEKVTF